MVVLYMNGFELSMNIDIIREICKNKNECDIRIEFRYDLECLDIYKLKEINKDGKCNYIVKPITVGMDYYPFFVRIEKFSLHNLKQLLSIVKKERMKVKEIVVKW